MRRMIHRFPYQDIFIYIFIILFFLFAVPVFSIRFFPHLIENPPKESKEILFPETVSVYITSEEKTKEIPFENYVAGVVASEMPDSFEPEALKAQSVASRTYALGRIHADTHLCDTVHCQVYRSDNIPDKVQDAVDATSGQVITYNGQLASQALYFSSSAGDTENAEDVFSNSYPYLVSVSSSYEPGATHKKESVSFSSKEFQRIIKDACPDTDFGTKKTSSIKILSHTSGGRVDEIQIGDGTVTGEELRTAFGLYSTRFEVSTSRNKVTFTTHGSGHGVGMSQYGANGLAKRGRSYKQILRHYYKGVTVTKGIQNK